MADETMTLEQVRDSLRRFGAHPNSLFSKWERAIESAIAARKVADAEVYEELDRAIAKFPTWPTDPLHALAVLGEEFGELTKAALQLTYEPGKSSREDVKAEAIQTAAMAIRFVRSLEKYEYGRSRQHPHAAAPKVTP